MKTIFIHPTDPSTEFLKHFYQNIPDKVVINGGYSKDELREVIKDFDRVVMCGHGTPNGLMSVGRFRDSWGYIIDETFVDVLNKKTENIFIWCHSNQFVRKHKLRGLHSGMFISELGEVEYCCDYDVPIDEINESNYFFSKLVGKHIHKSTRELYKIIKDEYGKFSISNRIGKYNWERIYYR